MVSDQGGKANFIAELKRRGIDVPQGRSEARRADLDRQGTRGDGLCL